MEVMNLTSVFEYLPFPGVSVNGPVVSGDAGQEPTTLGQPHNLKSE